MLAAAKGVIKDNTVLIEDKDFLEYEGAEVIVTLLNFPDKKEQKKPIDWDEFVILGSERGKDVDGYMREMRENDRM